MRGGVKVWALVTAASGAGYQQIDNLDYELYGLTEDEIKIVEETSRSETCPNFWSSYVIISREGIKNMETCLFAMSE